MLQKEMVYVFKVFPAPVMAQNLILNMHLNPEGFFPRMNKQLDLYVNISVSLFFVIFQSKLFQFLQRWFFIILTMRWSSNGRCTGRSEAEEAKA